MDRIVSNFRRASEALSLLIAFAGLAVLAGWAFDLPAVKSIFPGFVAMKANTALCFTLLGAGLWLAQEKRAGSRLCGNGAKFAAGAVMAIAFLTLLEYLGGRDLGLDQLLFREPAGAILTSSPGRMAFNAAALFLMLGAALLAIRRASAVFSYLAQGLALAGMFIALLSLIGYLYKSELIYLGTGLGFSTAMALYATVLFMLTGISLLFLRPERALMWDISSDSFGGVALRRLLPLILFFPPFFGWAKLKTEHALVFSNELGVSLVALSNITVLSLAVYFLARYLNRLDAALKKSSAEKELLYAEIDGKNKELEDYLYISSHDLRSPLVNMQGFSENIGRYFETLRACAGKHPEDIEVKALFDRKIPAALGFINGSVKKMDELIKGLLQVSRLGKTVMHPESLDVNGIVADALKQLGFAIHEKKAVITARELPRCYGDKAMVIRVFSNLLDNALKYSHPDRRPEISIRGTKGGGFARYTVEDNGIGIEKEYREKIWRMFYRLNPESGAPGEGIGLAMIKRIAQRHGGNITMESEPGSWTRFTLELPDKRLV